MKRWNSRPSVLPRYVGEESTKKTTSEMERKMQNAILYSHRLTKWSLPFCVYSVNDIICDKIWE